MPEQEERSITTKSLADVVYQIFEIFQRERLFIVLILALSIITFIVYPYPQIAMWVGFMLAAYSAIANDSIQTIGTFISSNSHRKWWKLWLFMGLVFVITVTYSWITFNGDVSYQRLQTKGFHEAPTSFSFLQLAAPIILLILTRLKMPVSTTFLLLSSFTTKPGAIQDVIFKSLSGYFVAFFLAIIVWFVIARIVGNLFKGKTAHPIWVVLQWITSGSLWSVWIMQDAANVAIFLPRSLSLTQFTFFAGFIFVGLGLLFYLKGDKIQGIVNEKTGVTDVRAATLIDFVYAIILFFFKEQSEIPMSTTWVFIGLLGGRELAISMIRHMSNRRKDGRKAALFQIGRDALFAGIGLTVSLLLAIAINDVVRNEFLELIGF